jgi:hypothetical protein
MGATLLGLGWNFEQVLTALVIPAALATAAVVIKAHGQPRRRRHLKATLLTGRLAR